MILMENHYSEIEKSYDFLYDIYEKSFGADSEDKFIEKFEKLVPKNAKILELGCGGGKLTIDLYNKGYKNIEGVDLSEKMLSIARKKLPNVKFTKMNFLDLASNYPKESFDVVFGAYCFCHIPKSDMVKALKAANYVLKKGGLVFAITQYGSEELMLDEPLYKGKKIFMNRMNENEIRGYCENAGFSFAGSIIRNPDPHEIQWKKLCFWVKKL
jgi:ubiquinone/menaquinone biosynthesis C-methylase UbiE